MGSWFECEELSKESFGIDYCLSGVFELLKRLKMVMVSARTRYIACRNRLIFLEPSARPSARLVGELTVDQGMVVQAFVTRYGYGPIIMSVPT